MEKTIVALKKFWITTNLEEFSALEKPKGED